ncbi:MAG: polysaccharide deacetylase family protein [Bacteroidota bacterium]
MMLRKIAPLLALGLWYAGAQSQQEAWSPKDRNWYIEMLFPEGKTKALVLSFDDGPVEDRKMVELLNKYDLKGTFHLNSGRLGKESVIAPEEVMTLYKGHEVSVHSYNHLGMNNVPNIDMFYEVGEDRRTLEQLSGQLVRGMAYPFGTHDPRTFTTLRDLGIEYARTVEDTFGFGIPDDFMLWHPTVHLFAKAGYMGNPPEKDEEEFKRFDALTKDFLQRQEVSLYYVWGHSWEYKDKWSRVEAFFKEVARKKDIFYTTHITLVDYIKAYRQLKISVDKTRFLNKSATEVFLRATNYSDVDHPIVKKIRIPAGESVALD